MATSFRFLYWRVCCYVCTKKPKKKRGKSVRSSNRSDGARLSRSRNTSFRRSVRTSTKSADSGFGLSDIGPSSHSDTDLRYNGDYSHRSSSVPRMRYNKNRNSENSNQRKISHLSTASTPYQVNQIHHPRGYSLDRKQYPRDTEIEMDPIALDNSSIFCNKYVVGKNDGFARTIPGKGDWGFSLTLYDIRLIVGAFLDRSGRNEYRFKNNMPDPDFVMSFLKRHQNTLSHKMCQNIKRARSKVDHNAINLYFDELNQSMEGVLPHSVINYDETNITDDPGRKNVVFRRGCRHPERIIDSSKSSSSVMFVAAGDGTLLPPYVTYKADNLYNTWTEHGPKGTVHNRSKSGWFTLEIFEDWFRKIALPYFSKQDKEGKKVIIGDNLSSHITPYIMEECKKTTLSSFYFLHWTHSAVRCSIFRST
ncbi:hypothetical protein JTB14_024268 [Gonioctena quinquepunctata]|nr:hypothetical protein JTB14_024268 [Gonioctena quinquepunctata]